MAEHQDINGEIGNVYGAIDEDMEFQTIDNPYYGGNDDMVFENTGNQRYNPGRNNMEIISAASNIYYGL